MAKSRKVRSKLRSKFRRKSNLVPPGVTYEAERDELIAAFKAGEGLRWDVGLHWYNLSHHRLWIKAGYRSPLAFLKGEILPLGLDVPNVATLSHWGRVAKEFERPVVFEIGMSRLLRALTYWGHRGKKDYSTKDPGAEPIEIPAAKGPPVVKALKDCTEDELEAANAAFAKPRPASGLTRQEAALQARLQSALAELTGPLEKGSVRLARTKDGLFIPLTLWVLKDKAAFTLNGLANLL